MPPLPSPFTAQALKDGLLTFDGGVNHGSAPELLKRNELFDAINTSLRNDFVHCRAYYQKRYLQYLVDGVKSVADAGWVQGGCYYKPDSGPETLMLAISGRLYQFTIEPDRALVRDVTGPGTTYQQSTSATQHWLWQAEKWVIWNDGISAPVFWNPIQTLRSNYGTEIQYSTFNTAAFLIPAVGDEVTVAFNSVVDLVVGDIITCTNRGTLSVQDIVGANVTLLNVNATPAGFNVTVPGAANMFWKHPGSQLPPGRMGAYGLGRNWVCLTDGKQFIASDCVGGSSGSNVAPTNNNFRDAVLYMTENVFLAGGGRFTIPSSGGEITAMRFASVLDAALGQGPLMVFTPNSVFSCQAPTDRLTWQDVTNPILSETLIGGGALGQDSTIPSNGDTIMRSIEGMRSLVLARREFATWGNTPISHEVDPLFQQDSQDLLPWSSAIVFDNRLFMTAGSILGKHGPYFRGVVPIDFDPVSSLKGKAPSIYDARIWEGLNTYKLMKGMFAKVERAFSFSVNLESDELELYELIPEDNPMVGDNGFTPVTWQFETSTLDFGQSDPRTRDYKRLINGEIWIDNLIGKALFQVWYKPDQWPCWVPWIEFEECAKLDAQTNPIIPQFRPRLGLGEPSGAFFDPTTNRPLREAYTYRMRFRITGHCVFKGARFDVTTIPEPRFAPPVAAAICP